MSWASATRKSANVQVFAPPAIEQHNVDWSRLVSLDFETFYDTDYTLSKLSTSEYIRDPRFEVLMCGIKIGNKPTVVVPGPKVRAYLAKINWATHALLCHNTQFDGFILSHHFGIKPYFTYCSLSMARGLFSNDIGAGLDEVSLYLGGKGKIAGGVEDMKGVGFKALFANKALWARSTKYCGQDVDEMLHIFKEMLPRFPNDEIGLIHITNRMFTEPVLKVNIPRVEKELARELAEREALFLNLLDLKSYEPIIKTILKTKAERALTGKERDLLIVKRVVGSNDKFAELLRAEGVEPPVKISPAWIKKDAEDRKDEDKWAFAFAKDDLDFINLPDDVEALSVGLDLNKKADVKKLVARQDRLRALVDARLAVKSTTNITRAERFLKAGANGWSLPCGYAYARAHTLRWGGNNKMNMQNLTRGGELRQSIEAPPGYVIGVSDSGQIEARVNGMLWGQHDLLEAFVAADGWDKSRGVARGNDRDAYCKFADLIYGREITTEDKMERFVGKVCIAEGQLVLTNRGLVPIQDISKLDRLWDGVEWVKHDGVIDQGIKDVITYDGLTATPDHEVFTQDGRIVPLGRAASEMVGLQRTGAGRENLWFSDDHVVADTPRKQLSVRVSPMLVIRDHEAGVSQQPEKRQNNVVPGEWPALDTPCGCTGPAVRRNHFPVQQPGQPAVAELRRPRDQVSIQDPDGIHQMGGEELAPRNLPGGGAGPARQQRALRADQHAVGNQGTASAQPAQYGVHFLGRQGSTAGGFSEPVQLKLDLRTSDQTSDDRRADSRQVRVFDIANAGPRKRFTVSGRLVLNCVLGLGFQMGAPKLQMTLAKGALGGPPVYFELDQCQIIVSAYRRKNSKIQRGWDICKGIIEDMAAGIEGSHGPISWGKETIYLPNGLTLRYPDLRKRTGDKGWDEWTYQAKDIRKKIYGGLLCLAPDTEVLTQRGWIRLLEVRSNDKVWDGLNWVTHSGVHHMGRKATIDFGGVRMTPDHEVLVDGAWIAAENTTHHEAASSFERHQGSTLRHADGYNSLGQRRTSDPVVDPVRLWAVSDHDCERLLKGRYKELRMLNDQDAQCGPYNSRHDAAPSIFSLAQHAGPLQPTDSPIVGTVRSTRNNSLCEVDVVSSVLERHGPYLRQGTGPGPQKQYARVYAQKLPLDDPTSQCSQHSSASADQHTAGQDAPLVSGTNFWHQQDDVVLPARRRMASRADVPEIEDVYDIVDAGPLHRFTVRGSDGRPFLVHNCENIVQALARIIIGEQMLAIDKFARVVMTTHDEIVTLLKKASAELTMRRKFKVMKTPPKWWPGIPLNCEGGYAENYSK